MLAVILITITFIVFVIGVSIIVIVLFYPLFKENQCPKCRKFWAVENSRQEQLGFFEKGTSLYPHVRFLKKRINYWGVVPHEKYAVHRQCKYCGYRWTLIEVREI